MGAQPRNVGGGGAVPVANDWNQFLRQQLTGMNPNQQNVQGLQQMMGNLPNMPAGLRGQVTGQMQNEINRLQSNAGQPQQQVGQATNGMLGNQQGNGFSNTGNGYSGLQSNQDFMQNVDPNDPRINTPEFQQYMQQRGQVVGGQGPQAGNFGPLPGNAQNGGSPFQNAFNMISGGPQQFMGPQFQNPYQSQTYQGVDLQQLPQNVLQGNGMADLSGLRNVQDTNANVLQGMGQRANLGNGGLESILNQMRSTNFGAGAGSSVGAERIALDPARQIDLNSPEIQAQQQIADRQRMLAVADQRARFGAEGAGALGSGAQFAEGTLNAEFGPRMAALLQQNIAQQQAMDLNERQARAGVGLQSAGMGLQASMANAQNALQGQGMNLNALNSAMSGTLQGRGQDLQNQLGNRGMDVQQLGMDLNQQQGNQGAGIALRGQDMSGILQNQGLGNQFQFQNAGLNQNALTTNNSQAMQNAGMQNQFNLNNAGQSAQYQQGANGMNQQGFQNGMGQFLQMLGMGQQQNQFGAGLSQNMLGQLFGAFGQANGLGTPQAQTVMQPSGLGQAVNMGLGLGSAYLGGGGNFGGLFGGGGGGGAPQQGGSYPGLFPMPQMQQFGGFGGQPSIFSTAR
jgi:hypothetical protein